MLPLLSFVIVPDGFINIIKWCIMCCTLIRNCSVSEIFQVHECRLTVLPHNLILAFSVEFKFSMCSLCPCEPLSIQTSMHLFNASRHQWTHKKGNFRYVVELICVCTIACYAHTKFFHWAQFQSSKIIKKVNLYCLINSQLIRKLKRVEGSLLCPCEWT